MHVCVAAADCASVCAGAACDREQVALQPGQVRRLRRRSPTPRRRAPTLRSPGSRPRPWPALFSAVEGVVLRGGRERRVALGQVALPAARAAPVVEPGADPERAARDHLVTAVAVDVTGPDRRVVLGLDEPVARQRQRRRRPQLRPPALGRNPRPGLQARCRRGRAPRRRRRRRCCRSGSTPTDRAAARTPRRRARRAWCRRRTSGRRSSAGAARRSRARSGCSCSVPTTGATRRVS